MIGSERGWRRWNRGRMEMEERLEGIETASTVSPLEMYILLSNDDIIHRIRGVTSCTFS